MPTWEYFLLLYMVNRRQFWSGIHRQALTQEKKCVIVKNGHTKGVKEKMNRKRFLSFILSRQQFLLYRIFFVLLCVCVCVCTCKYMLKRMLTDTYWNKGIFCSLALFVLYLCMFVCVWQEKEHWIDCATLEKETVGQIFGCGNTNNANGYEKEMLMRWKSTHTCFTRAWWQLVVCIWQEMSKSRLMARGRSSGGCGPLMDKMDPFPWKIYANHRPFIDLFVCVPVYLKFIRLVTPFFTLHHTNIWQFVKWLDKSHLWSISIVSFLSPSFQL